MALKTNEEKSLGENAPQGAFVNVASRGFAIALAILSGCGGDEPPRVIEGRLAHAADQQWKVCFDSNQNLNCDAGEDSATTGPDGSYRLSLAPATDLAGRHLVAELPLANDAGSPATVLRLASPSNSPVISSMSTLVVARLLTMPTESADNAQQFLRRQLALNSTANLLSVPKAGGNAGQVRIAAAPDASSNAEFIRTADMAMIGFQTAARQIAAQPGMSAPDGPTNAQVLRITADTTLATLSRYADPSRGGLLDTLTARTIKGEVGDTLNPKTCSIAAPLRMRIDTNGGAAITSKDDYVKATLTTDASATHGQALSLATQIRGRGNSTWGMPKKPYKIKLDKAAPLVGMQADKEWALLANYSDKSMLRNAVAFCLGKTLGMAYTPDFRFVELELNGQYQGLYLLTEHIKTSDNRVDIGKDVPSAGDPGGFLLEIDARLDGDYPFHSGVGIPYIFKSDTNSAQAALVSELIARFEQRLFSEDFAARDPNSYLNMLDVEALIDFYLVNEFMRNNDAFWSSTFVTRKNDGPLTFGPLWDFDIAAGNINYNGNEATEGWWTRHLSAYVQQLLKDPTFEKHVAARWKHLSAQLPALQGFIHQSAATLDAAQARNFQTWDILGVHVWPNAVVTGSYAGEIDYLSDWLQRRATWMDQALGNTAVPPQNGTR